MEKSIFETLKKEQFNFKKIFILLFSKIPKIQEKFNEI